MNASAWVFIMVGFLFALGSLIFLVTREIPSGNQSKNKHRQSFMRYVIVSVRHILKNKNFLFFLGGDMDYFVVVTIISFYANYATTFCGIQPAIAAGAFVTCIYTGAIMVNIFLGC